MRYLSLKQNMIMSNIVTLFVALLLVSCEKRDNYYDRGNGFCETICFSVVDSNVQTRKALGTVDNNKITHKTVLSTNDSNDFLYLSACISDMNSSQSMMTRAEAFLSSNLEKFAVYGYNYDGEEVNYKNCFIHGKIATKNIQDQKWYFSEKEYWLGGNNRFFCVANHMEDNVVNKSSVVTISTTEGGKPMLMYTVPVDVSKHRDVVVAKADVESNISSVPLIFEHIFTAVQFKFGEIIKFGQIHSITLQDIGITAALDLGYESAMEFMAQNAWGKPFVIGDINLSFGENGNIIDGNIGRSIATLDNKYALMMIPQTLDGAKVVIEYTPNGGEKISMEAKLSGTWQPGKVVTYTISIS